MFVLVTGAVVVLVIIDAGITSSPIITRHPALALITLLIDRVRSPRPKAQSGW
jgi:hypothetical protein